MEPSYAKEQSKEVVKRQDVIYGERQTPHTSIPLSSFLFFSFLIFSSNIFTWESGRHCCCLLRLCHPLPALPQDSPALRVREVVVRDVPKDEDGRMPGPDSSLPCWGP